MNRTEAINLLKQGRKGKIFLSEDRIQELKSLPTISGRISSCPQDKAKGKVFYIERAQKNIIKLQQLYNCVYSYEEQPFNIYYVQRLKYVIKVLENFMMHDTAMNYHLTCEEIDNQN